MPVAVGTVRFVYGNPTLVGGTVTLNPQGTAGSAVVSGTVTGGGGTASASIPVLAPGTQYAVFAQGTPSIVGCPSSGVVGNLGTFTTGS